jgi:hypothetical protein
MRATEWLLAVQLLSCGGPTVKCSKQQRLGFIRLGGW